MQTASPPELQASTATFSRETTIIAQKRPQVKNAITMSSRKSSSPVRVTPPRHATSAIVSPDDSAANTLLSLLRRERPQAKPSATVAAAPKRLSVEPADSRPSRWSQKSTVTSAGKKAANRRKSVPNALQRKHRTGRYVLLLIYLARYSFVMLIFIVNYQQCCFTTAHRCHYRYWGRTERRTKRHRRADFQRDDDSQTSSCARRCSRNRSPSTTTSD